MSLEEVGRTLGTESAWEEAREPILKLGGVYGENGGPFVLGSEGSWFFLCFCCLIFLLCFHSSWKELVLCCLPIIYSRYDHRN